jgi:hypothetical protein
MQRRRALSAFLAPLSFLVMVAADGQAAAQEPARNETVTNRNRPEVDPLGIRMGGFLFFPQLGLGAKYDDNVFAQEADEIDDTIYLVQPELALRSNWNNHALNFVAGAEAGYYNENDSENYVDTFVGSDLRLDVSRDSYLTAAVKYSMLHEGRDEPDDTGGAEPTEYSLLAADAGFANDFGLISFGISGGFDRYDFDDNVDGTNNDDRDRDQWQGTLRLGVDVSPNFEIFARGTYFTVAYDVEAADDDNNLDRDSTGYEAVLGVDFDLTGVTFGELFAGYRAQDPDDSQFDSIEGAQFGGAVTWNPSGLTTIRGQVVRDVRETTQIDTPGYLATEADLTIDHELLRSLILGANAGYEKRAYEDIPRDDTRVDAGLYVKYLMNRHLYVSLNYSYADLRSDIDTAEFTKNVIMLRLQTQY